MITYKFNFKALIIKMVISLLVLTLQIGCMFIAIRYRVSNGTHTYILVGIIGIFCGMTLQKFIAEYWELKNLKQCKKENSH
jgi:uncharacterized membrane protein HdeD (DUF308 family)